MTRYMDNKRKFFLRFYIFSTHRVMQACYFNFFCIKFFPHLFSKRHPPIPPSPLLFLGFLKTLKKSVARKPLKASPASTLNSSKTSSGRGSKILKTKPFSEQSFSKQNKSFLIFFSLKRDVLLNIIFFPRRLPPRYPIKDGSYMIHSLCWKRNLLSAYFCFFTLVRLSFC